MAEDLGMFARASRPMTALLAERARRGERRSCCSGRTDGTPPRGAHLEDSPDVVEEGDEHPSKRAGDGLEVARDLLKLAVDVRERVGER